MSRIFQELETSPDPVGLRRVAYAVYDTETGDVLEVHDTRSQNWIPKTIRDAKIPQLPGFKITPSDFRTLIHDAKAAGTYRDGR